MSEHSSKCPTCGHVTKARKRAPAVAQLTAVLTDAQLYAHYKATAPGKDLAFFVAHSTYINHQTQTEEYQLGAHVDPNGRLTGISRPEFYRRLRNLQDAWRQESNRRDTHPIGTPGWLAEYQAAQDARDAADAAVLAQADQAVAS